MEILSQRTKYVLLSISRGAQTQESGAAHVANVCMVRIQKHLLMEAKRDFTAAFLVSKHY